MARTRVRTTGDLPAANTVAVGDLVYVIETGHHYAKNALNVLQDLGVVGDIFTAELLAEQLRASASEAPALVVVQTKTNDYTLAASDSNSLIRMNKVSANNLTVPKDSDVPIAVGASMAVRQIGAGVTTLVAASGVTLNNPGSDLHLSKQLATAQLVKVATDEWDIIGGTTGA